MDDWVSQILGETPETGISDTGTDWVSEAIGAEPEAPPSEDVSDTGFGHDLLMSWGIGSNQLLKGLGTIYGLATDNMDNWARRQGERGIQYYREGDVAHGARGQSEELKLLEEERRLAVDEAEGFMAEAGTALWHTIKSPRLLTTLVTQSLPHLAAGGAAGRLVGAAGAAAGASEAAAGTMAAGGTIGSMGALQGADVAGEHYEQMMQLPDSLWSESEDYQQLIDQGIDSAEAKDQIATKSATDVFFISTGISVASQAVIPYGATLEKVLAGKRGQIAGGIVARGIKGGIGEGVQEVAEEAGGQLASNIAMQGIDPERDPMQDVGMAAGVAFPAGFIFGAPAGMASPAPALDESEIISDEVMPLEFNKDVIDKELFDAANRDLSVAAEQARQAQHDADLEEMKAARMIDDIQLKTYPNYMQAEIERRDLEGQYGETGLEPARNMEGAWVLATKGQADLWRLSRERADQAVGLRPAEEGEMIVEEIPPETIVEPAPTPEGIEVTEIQPEEVGEAIPQIGVQEITEGEETIEMRQGPIYPGREEGPKVPHQRRIPPEVAETAPVVEPEPDTKPVVSPETAIEHTQEGKQPSAPDLMAMAAQIQGAEASEAQIEADNYKKAHPRYEGLQLSLENKPGDIRGARRQHHFYGDIKGTEGADGDAVDVFLNKDNDPEADTPVFIINKIDPKTGEFDETKVMLGFDTMEAAEQGYHVNYQKDWQGMEDIFELTVDDLKQWLNEGDTTKRYLPADLQKIQDDIDLADLTKRRDKVVEQMQESVEDRIPNQMDRIRRVQELQKAAGDLEAQIAARQAAPEPEPEPTPEPEPEPEPEVEPEPDMAVVDRAIEQYKTKDEVLSYLRGRFDKDVSPDMLQRVDEAFPEPEPEVEPEPEPEPTPEFDIEVDEVLSVSAITPEGKTPLDQIELTAEVGDRKITHTAKHWVDAFDQRIRDLSKLRGCTK